MSWLYGRIRTLLRDDRGSLSDMVWVIGAAVVVVAIIVGLKTIAPNTANSMWNTITNWVQNQFNFQ